MWSWEVTSVSHIGNIDKHGHQHEDILKSSKLRLKKNDVGEMVRVFAIPQKIDHDVYFSYLKTPNTLFDRHNPKLALQNAFLVRAFRDSSWTLHEYRRDSDVPLLSYHRNLTRRRRGVSWDTTWSKHIALQTFLGIIRLGL